MKKLVIKKSEEGIRLIKYIKKYFNTMPDSLLHKLLRKNYFKINDKKAKGDETLKVGDKIYIYIGEDTYDKYKSSKKEDIEEKKIFANQNNFDIIDKIIYEDDNIVLFNKPVGMLSQGDKTGDISVNEILLSHVDTKCDIFTPSIVNRLDRNTSGIIIFAKTNVAARAISNMIKDGKLEKRYRTKVNGIVEKDEDILIHLYKKDERNNIAVIKNFTGKLEDGYTIVKLSYKVLKRYTDTTDLDINLFTGKSHQIRAQLAYIGHPIVCDKKYMDKTLYDDNVKHYKMKSQFLCCYKIRFPFFKEVALRNLCDKIFKI